MPQLEDKITQLRLLLKEFNQVLVCFSGGVDSGFLLAESVAVLGDSAVALTAVSPSLAQREGSQARLLAQKLGARHRLVESHELDDPRYTANPVDRCYFCKTEVYGLAVREAGLLEIPHVLDGFNRDDRGDHRPGHKAALQNGVRSPLDECGFTKADIREAARRIDLPVWDKPALACLSSRFPYGTPITPERLAQVERCEQVLQDLGFRVYRVRYHDRVARIEVAPEEFQNLLSEEVRDEVTRRFRENGFAYVALDLEGYRSGSLNETVSEGREKFHHKDTE